MHKEWEARLASMLGERRLRHSYCVRDRAIVLAERHGADRSKAAIAGLLHDICHDMPKDAQLKTLLDSGILVDALTIKHPQLWHAMCGALYLEQELGVTDREILDAVRYHTTGRAGMTTLDMVVFLADATSAERRYPGVEEKRRLADESLERAMLRFLTRELEQLLAAGSAIVEDCWAAYNYFALRLEDTI